jgi:acyl dehydratase
MNPQPLHIDAHFAEKTEFGQLRAAEKILALRGR